MSSRAHPWVRPRALRRGSRLAIVSPASAARTELVDAGLQAVEALGFVPEVMAHTRCSGPLYYAGSIKQRVQDLHEAFRDPAIDGILCTRGGWGSAELLPQLDQDTVCENPKPFVGYSDHTSLHLWLQQRCGLCTFYGPMVAADFSRENGVDPLSWEQSLMRTNAWGLGKETGLRMLRAGHAEGPVLGGCLAIVAESLGTPFAPRWDDPYILFLEDVGVAPYQWDRMLLHLRYAGLLENATGIVLGDMAQSAPPEQQELLEQAVLHALGDFAGPIAIGLRCGHVFGGNITLPLGVGAELRLEDGAEPCLRILESAVTL